MPKSYINSDTEMSEVSDENAMSEASDISEMSLEEQLDRSGNENGSDTDNPYNGEPEDFTAERVFNWITEFQPQDEDGESEYIEYSEIDYDEIVRRTSSTVLREVIDALMKKEIKKKNNSYFGVIKCLTSAADISLKDCDYLEKYVNEMVKDEDEEAVKFLVEYGAHEETAIESAIHVDSVTMLELLDAEVNDNFLQIAIDNEAWGTLEYFLEQDFVASYELILDAAIENSNSKFVDLVCDKAELEQVYDLVKYLVEKGGDIYISVFFKHFDLKDLLIEIQEQDDNLGFYNLLLDRAKDFLSESQLSNLQIKKLLASFDKKLQISTQALIYPTANFRGNPQLKELREALNRNTRLTDQEAKLAINFIGVNLSTVNRYLALSPNHPSETSKSETYFRSAKHPFSIFVKPVTARFEPNSLLPEAKAKKGMAREAHLGLYRTPLDSLNKSKEIKLSQKAKNNKVTSGDSLLYNALLHYKRRICYYIANKFSDNNNPIIKVGFYHDYPCVMVWIPKPTFVKKPTEAALTAWTNIVISYFVGLVNYLAQTKNLNIELVRRSSFSFSSPSVAPCGQSFRLSVGIIPTDYADIINEGLGIINEVLQILNQPDNLNHQNLSTKLPDMCFIKSTAYKNYLKPKKIPPVKNLLDLIWAKVDRAGKTGAFNLMRTSAARDGLSQKVYQEICNISPQTEFEFTSIFLNALRWGMSKITVVEKRLKFHSYETFKYNKLLKTHAVIADTDFLNFIAQLSKTIKIQKNSLPEGLILNNMTDILSAVENSYTQRIIGDLYFHLEMFNELLFSKAIFTFSSGNADSFGSDSEVDDESDEDENSFENTELKTHCYGKKIIVQNGMRAILGALHAGAHFLFPQYLTIHNAKPKLFLHGAYYETPEALQLLAKFNVFREIDDINEAQIMIYDINACVTTGEKLPFLEEHYFEKIKVLLIDSTSASIEEHQHWIQLFQSQSQMQILFFVSSGFKNEQMGADKNPYGTIRVFTKTKQTQKTLLDFIKTHEEPIKSNISHHYRRLMKEIGNTPCNHTIFFAPPQKSTALIPDDNEENLKDEVDSYHK